MANLGSHESSEIYHKRDHVHAHKIYLSRIYIHIQKRWAPIKHLGIGELLGDIEELRLLTYWDYRYASIIMYSETCIFFRGRRVLKKEPSI